MVRLLFGPTVTEPTSPPGVTAGSSTLSTVWSRGGFKSASRKGTGLDWRIGTFVGLSKAVAAGGMNVKLSWSKLYSPSRGVDACLCPPSLVPESAASAPSSFSEAFWFAAVADIYGPHPGGGHVPTVLARRVLERSRTFEGPSEPSWYLGCSSSSSL